MCSSSKVKCNKEKPTCSRCRKLGYPCFYSPARRIGRPHPNRRTLASKATEARPRLRGRSTIHNSTPPTPEHLPRVSDIQHQNPALAQQGGGSDPSYAQNPLQWLDEFYSSPQAGIDDSDRASATFASHFHGFKHSIESEQLECDLQSPVLGQFPNIPEAFDADPHWTHCFPPQFDNTIFQLDIGLDQSSGQNCSAEASSNTSLSRDLTPGSDSPEPDCVTGALEILRRLQNPQRKNPFGPHNKADGLSLDIEVASSAVNRLTTILVCPCSRKTYVGILVAAVCLDILDLYDSLFAQPKSDDLSGTLADKLLAMNSFHPFSMGLDDDKGEGLESMDFDRMGESSSQVSHVRILEELSKLANMVMQFSRRYKGDATAGTLSALADSLKFRLRLVTNEALKRGSY